MPLRFVEQRIKDPSLFWEGSPTPHREGMTKVIISTNNKRQTLNGSGLEALFNAGTEGQLSLCSFVIPSSNYN